MSFLKLQTASRKFIGDLEKAITDDICQTLNGNTSRRDEFWHKIGYTECVQIVDNFGLKIEIVGRGFKYCIEKNMETFSISLHNEHRNYDKGNPNYKKFEPEKLEENLALAIKMVEYFNQNADRYREMVLKAMEGFEYDATRD